MSMRAFTLIETIVYVALFSMLMTGTLIALADVRTAAARTETKSLLLEEGTFLLETIGHAIAGGSAISTLYVSDSALVQESVPGAPQRISGNQVRVSNLSLVRTGASGGEPAYVDVTFTLTANAGDGRSLAQVFSERAYSATP
ncbi:MAG: hypothetical protein JWL88_5 [Parcubacteria group bacterium]|nr:hypothetical protein [Parcubacteria group bacterium]